MALTPNEMVVTGVAAREVGVDEDVCANPSINLLEVVHVHLADEGPPLVVTEVLDEEFVGEFAFVVDDDLCAIFAETDDIGLFLSGAWVTSNMRASLVMN